MKKNELASKLNGIDLDDFPSQLASEARRAGLVVVLGVSADTVEFHGAISGEADAPGGDTIFFDAAGLLPHPDDLDGMNDVEQRLYYERKKFAESIDAEWQKDGFQWTLTMVPPHSRFVALKDGARYCRGIIFRLFDVGLVSPGK